MKNNIIINFRHGIILTLEKKGVFIAATKGFERDCISPFPESRDL